MQQQNFSINNNSTSPPNTNVTCNNASFAACSSPSLDFTSGYAHNALRFAAHQATTTNYPNEEIENNESSNVSHQQQRSQQQFGTKHAIHNAMTSSSYAQLPSVTRERNTPSSEHLMGTFQSSNNNAAASMAVYPFATLQRGGGQSARHTKPPALGTFALRNTAATIPDSSSAISFVKSRIGVASRGVTSANAQELKTETSPSFNISNNNLEEENEENKISRAHSLRDLASKFERISTASNTGNAIQNSSQNSIKLVEDSQKAQRYFADNNSIISSAGLAHHAAPTLRDEPVVSKDYLVELYKKLTGK